MEVLTGKWAEVWQRYGRALRNIHYNSTNILFTFIILQKGTFAVRNCNAGGCSTNPSTLHMGQASEPGKDAWPGAAHDAARRLAYRRPAAIYACITCLNIGNHCFGAGFALKKIAPGKRHELILHVQPREASDLHQEGPQGL